MIRILRLSRRAIFAMAVPVAAIGTAATPLLAQQASATADVETDSVELEVLMRGPVHEGFAEPMGGDRDFLELPEPAPEPIEELPAAVRPISDGREATWVPGYWGVEGEADELVWISGTWRYAPPNMRWVPGYWSTADNSSVWVSGFWADSSVERVEYLPAPPPVEDYEPTVEAPGDGYFWVPGQYVWTGNDYEWEEGFWARAQTDWVWVPSHYVWTPRGYIYVAGYWDYPVETRGVLFAPVRVATTYRQSYRPQVAINVTRAMVHWFVRPNYRHYYFGNYYGNRYDSIGFVPWVAYMERPTYYDPLYSYYSTARVDYLQNLVATHRQIDVAAYSRLPVSYSGYRQWASSAPANSDLVRATSFATPVQQLVTQEGARLLGDLRFERLGDEQSPELEQVREQIQSTRRFAQGRLEAEAEGDAASARRERVMRPRVGDDRPETDRPETDRPETDRPETDRPDTDRPDTDRPDTDRPEANRPETDRPRSERPERGATEGSRGSFDLGPFRGRARGEARAEAQQNDRPAGDRQPADALDRAERERGRGAPDASGAASDAADRAGARNGQTPRGVDALRPPPRLDGRQQRGAAGQRGAADRPRGARPEAPGQNAAERALDRPRAGAERPNAQRPNAQRPNAERPNAQRPNALRPGADAPRAAGERGRQDRPGRQNRPAAERPTPTPPPTAGGNPPAAGGNPPAAPPSEANED